LAAGRLLPRFQWFLVSTDCGENGRFDLLECLSIFEFVLVGPELRHDGRARVLHVGSFGALLLDPSRDLFGFDASDGLHNVELGLLDGFGLLQASSLVLAARELQVHEVLVSELRGVLASSRFVVRFNLALHDSTKFGETDTLIGLDVFRVFEVEIGLLDFLADGGLTLDSRNSDGGYLELPRLDRLRSNGVHAGGMKTARLASGGLLQDHFFLFERYHAVLFGGKRLGSLIATYLLPGLDKASAFWNVVGRSNLNQEFTVVGDFLEREFALGDVANGGVLVDDCRCILAGDFFLPLWSERVAISRLDGLEGLRASRLGRFEVEIALANFGIHLVFVDEWSAELVSDGLLPGFDWAANFAHDLLVFGRDGVVVFKSGDLLASDIAHYSVSVLDCDAGLLGAHLLPRWRWLLVGLEAGHERLASFGWRLLLCLELYFVGLELVDHLVVSGEDEASSLDGLALPVLDGFGSGLRAELFEAGAVVRLDGLFFGGNWRASGEREASLARDLVEHSLSVAVNGGLLGASLRLPRLDKLGGDLLG